MSIHRILIIGGYGNYGRIIAEKLTLNPNITLIIAGRNKQKAIDFAATLNRAEGIALNSQIDNLANKLQTLNVDLLIFTAGPFQNQDYRVAKAAIDAKVHYIDIADGRDFVCNMPDQLHQLALNHKVFVATGVSSVPGLTSSVVNHYLPQFSQLTAVDYGISTSEKMPGLSTVSSMLSYCGRPILQLKNGEWIKRYGWQDLKSHTFPSPVGKRYLGACDIPDTALFPRYYSDLKSATFSAGTKMPITHFGTWLLSWLIRFKIIRNPRRLTSLLHWCGERFERFYNGYSAIYITLSGKDHEQKEQIISWELIAENNEGIMIPAMATVALTHKLIAQSRLQIENQSGVFNACSLLTYEEYLNELNDITMTIHENKSQS